MRWKCECMFNADVDHPIMKSCILEQENPEFAPLRCPFQIQSPYWKEVVE